jgi:hypothetical protein
MPNANKQKVLVELSLWQVVCPINAVSRQHFSSSSSSSSSRNNDFLACRGAAAAAAALQSQHFELGKKMFNPSLHLELLAQKIAHRSSFCSEELVHAMLHHYAAAML